MMFSVLIADDEQLIRSGLTTGFEYIGIVPDVLYEASDGKEALDIIRDKQPDIVITDIRMSVPTGVTLLETVKTDFPDIEFIILTDYTEFEYIKRAMDFDVHSYILKPFSNEELKNALLKTVDTIRNKRIVRREKTGRLFWRYIQSEGQNTAIRQTLEKSFCTKSNRYTMLCIIQESPHALLNDIDELTDRLARNRQKENSAKNIRFFCFRDFTHNNRCVVLVCSPAPDFAESAVRILHEAWYTLNAPNVLPIICCSEIHTGLALSLFAQADEVCTAAASEFETSEKKHIFFYSKKNAKRISEKREKKTEDDSDVLVKTSGNKRIKAAANYIRSNYSQNINTAYIAKKYTFSPNYFSFLFKKETGCNFVEYLAHVRIEKACAFLKHTDLNIHDIAQKVGYGDSQYFFRVFKKATGLTPAEYRKKIRFKG